MSNEKRKKGLVLLADGTTFYGRSAGIEGTSYGEICLNNFWFEVFCLPLRYLYWKSLNPLLAFGARYKPKIIEIIAIMVAPTK